MMIAEAWTAYGDDIPKSGFAVDAKNRGEALMLNAANSQGEAFAFEAMIERRRQNAKKIKRLGATQVDEDGFQFLLYPFMKEWGCVDEKKMQRNFEHMDAMGVETPHIPTESTIPRTKEGKP